MKAKLPRQNQYFIAYLRGYRRHQARGGLMRCRKSKPKLGTVEAMDQYGFVRIFNRREFEFVF